MRVCGPCTTGGGFLGRLVASRASVVPFLAVELERASSQPPHAHLELPEGPEQAFPLRVMMVGDPTRISVVLPPLTTLIFCSTWNCVHSFLFVTHCVELFSQWLHFGCPLSCAPMVSPPLSPQLWKEQTWQRWRGENTVALSGGDWEQNGVH